jgi:hypothetical protein
VLSRSALSNLYCRYFLDAPDILNELIWDAPTLI